MDSIVFGLHDETKFPGAWKTKNGKYASAIRDPIKKKRVWLGTFSAAQEASKAYLAKQCEFAPLIKANQHCSKKPEILLGEKRPLFGVERLGGGALSPMANDQSSDTAGVSRNERSNSPETKFTGVRKRKNGKYAAEIRDPIKKKGLWLGTFSAAQEASKAYFSKKCEFEKLNQGKQGGESKDCEQLQPDISGGELSPLANDQSLNTADVSRNARSNSPKKIFTGVRKRKSRKYAAVIRGPIKKKRVWLGTFSTAQEASKAYFSKKCEFEKLNQEKQGSKSKNCEQLQPDSSGGELNAVADDQSLNTAGVSRNARSNSPETILTGVRKRKSGKYAAVIRDPIKKKRVWLGTFSTTQEASKAYFSKKCEFEKLNQEKQGSKSKNCEQLQPDSSGGELNAVADDQSLNTAGVSRNARSNSPETIFTGVRKRKCGKYAAVIRDPIKKKRVWLGTFSNAQEANKAYFSKKCEFEKLNQEKQGSKSKNCEQLQPDSSGGELSPLANDQFLNTAGVSRNGRSNSPETTHFIGVRKRNSGNYTSEIRNPISKRKFWLGTYGTAEEASRAYQSKKLEFQKQLKAKQQCGKLTSSAREKQDGKKKLVNVKLGHEAVNREGLQPESAGGSSSSEIDVPISNSSDGGSDQGIDFREIIHSMRFRKGKSGKYTTEITNPISMTKNLLATLVPTEDAFHANLSKKLDFQSSEKVELQSHMPTDSTAGEKHAGQEDEDLWMGQWVQLPGDRAVKLSLRLGLPIIDNYGSLLGEFSCLDDLSIC